MTIWEINRCLTGGRNHDNNIATADASQRPFRLKSSGTVTVLGSRCLNGGRTREDSVAM